jgi:hypothetical protein
VRERRLDRDWDQELEAEVEAESESGPEWEWERRVRERCEVYTSDSQGKPSERGGNGQIVSNGEGMYRDLSNKARA